MKLYGIPNCSTVKKARDWLDANHIPYEFHDFKKKGIDEATLNVWLTQQPWEKLINRAGLTWRGLDDATKSGITDNASAIKLMQAKTSVIKRPILEKDQQILAVGFSESEYKNIFHHAVRA
ncbi:MAG: ArsC family reductase [Betaproteobacteria bacterium HGW-Betaproteobacteria-22]|nr:MAG: ArsC family reductase [Betaproteobacteria bacterium HGW-Betaproteobacteria-22]